MSRIRRITPAGTGWLLLTLLLTGWMTSSLVAEAQAADADHLIITEVVTKTRIIGSARLGSEFIEVVNPTLADIDLSDVYLTDGIFATNSTYYWNIADGVPSTATIGGGAFNDFHVRFPDGYVLAAGDTLAISINGSNQYAEAYGQMPDFELYEDANAPDTVPEMVAVFPGSVHGGDPLGEANTSILPTLSDDSESLILYSWDGASDLVADVDFVFWGTNTNGLFDKAGVTVGAGTYLADTAVASQVAISPSEQNFGQAYARLTADEGTETTTGGNGVSGHDETSENLGTTWQIATTQNPPQAPAVPFLTAPVFTAGANAPGSPYEDQDAILTVDVESNSALTGVDFMYTVDGGAPSTLTGINSDGATWSATLPAQAVDAVVAWYAMATNADGRTATWPAVAPTFSEGWTVGTAPVAGDGPAKLLMTEIATIGSDQEFIEIANLGDTAVDLSDYYLTDASHTSGNYYWRIAEGNPGPSTVGGGSFADFHSRFPDGFSIAAGDTIVVSMAGSALFSGTFGFLPDLELWEDDAFPDAVPDMRWVFGDEINNSIINRTGADPSVPTLTNGAEMVMLYYWDGVSDDVTDIDLFTWKDPSSDTTSFFFTKTGVTIGTHSYLPETSIADQLNLTFPTQASFGSSYHRIDTGEGSQAAVGGNGTGGRDETSEDLFNTFELAEYDPSRPSGGGSVGGGGVELLVEAKTFLPTMGETFPIRFVSKPQSETKLRLFDQSGRIVITLFDSRFNGSPSTLTDAPTVVVWDGLDNTYQRVRAGMYIAHLSVVNNATGEEETVVAPVVVATRLSK